MDQRRIEHLAQAAVQAVAEAGAIARRYFRTELHVDNKLNDGTFDPVTRADREIEQFLRAELARLDPSIGIVGEEFGSTGPSDEYWIIDPIDGTRAFMSGMLGWGILLGLVTHGRAVAGIMHQPFTGEMFVGTPQGARLFHQGTEATLRTSTRTDLARAILYSTDPRLIAAGDLTAAFTELAAKCRLQRWGGDCYSMALVAQGSIDLVVEGPIAPYDIVPLIALVEGAGGIVTDLDGKSPLGGGAVIVAANAALHAAALGIMRAAVAG
jgi:myo-inositol-1(or 4)-monophosphatase